MTFAELSLPPKINQSIKDLNYETPTPIQAQTIPILMQEPTDFLGIAATGTGKTAAYGIPLLAKLQLTTRHTEAIILAPTRELAKQITDNLRQLSKNMDVSLLCIYGGAGYRDQIMGLRRGAHVIVATPGRLVDHIQQGNMNLSHVKTVILDEADEMISMGFAEDMESILKAVRAGDDARQVNSWLFSATMQPELRKIADRYLKKPKIVTINSSQMLSGTVEQIYYTLREDQKIDAVCRILDVTEDFHGLVFCQTKSLVDEVDAKLRDRGYASDQLHGDRSQTERERTLDRFRRKHVRVLVCTDVAARGLDVKNLSHVINFSLPRELDSYVHRIGRTGRSGKPGIAISLVTPSHIGLVRRIESITRSTLTRGTIPSGQDVATNKLKKLVQSFSQVPVTEDIKKLVEQIWTDELESMSGLEMISRLVCMLLPDLGRVDDRPIGIDISDRPRSFRDDRNRDDRTRNDRSRGGPRSSFGGRGRDRAPFPSDRPRRGGGPSGGPRRGGGDFGGRPQRSWQSGANT